MGNPAVEAVKELETETGPGEVTLSTGVRVRLRPVPAWLVQETQNHVLDPEVPIWHNPDKGRDEPNPADPAYLAALQRAQARRAEAGTDVLVLYGVELVDGVPPDEDWLPRLRFLEKRGLFSFEGYDLSDPLERAFVFVKFCAMGNSDWGLLGRVAGLSGEDVQRAVESFRGDAGRRSDNGSAAKE